VGSPNIQYSTKLMFSYLPPVLNVDDATRCVCNTPIEGGKTCSLTVKVNAQTGHLTCWARHGHDATGNKQSQAFVEFWHRVPDDTVADNQGKIYATHDVNEDDGTRQDNADTVSWIIAKRVSVEPKTATAPPIIVTLFFS